MTVLVAGNVTDSVFAASVQPFNRATAFGDPNEIVLPTGQIAAKVDGHDQQHHRDARAPRTRPSTPTRSTSTTGPVIPPERPRGPLSRAHSTHPCPGTPCTRSRINQLKAASRPRRPTTAASPEASPATDPAGTTAHAVQ